MKKIYLLLLMFILPLAAGCNSVVAEAEYVDVYENTLEDTEIIVENEYLSMRFDTATTQFVIYDKIKGKEWYSNPPEAVNDTSAIKSITEKLQSQIVLTYGQSSGSLTEVNNCTLSVINDTYAFEKIDNGIKVKYTIGKITKEIVVPKALSETRIMEYYNQMEKSEKRQIDNYYRIIDINKLLATDNKAELLVKYPELDEERMFILRENMQRPMQEKMAELFAKYGYTQEDFEEDKKRFESEAEADSLPAFDITVVYQLDGPDFIVSVPLEEIQYKSSYPIVYLTVLPFFGAGGLDDEGFMLVPDASGAIINFNNGKQAQSSYVNSVYGYDYGLKRTAMVSDNGAYYPVFGINNNGSSFICVIENGVESASIDADVSGRIHSYNFVSSRFTVFNSDDIDISKANVFAKVFENKVMEGSYSQRYIFTDAKDYVDMAVTYRNYLMNKYPELKKTNESSIPVVMELIGAIDRTTNILGVPVSVSDPLTTYKQSTDIVSSFLNSGMKNLSVKYSGWFNGGVTHDAPGNVKLVSALGNKKDFSDMVSFMDSNGVDLYLESDFNFIYNVGMFNGFSPNRDAAKRISREVAKMYQYSFQWFGEKDYIKGRMLNYYLASPEYAMNAIDSYTSNINKLGVNNIAFSSIGRLLSADYNKKKPVSREEVMFMQQDKLNELKGNGSKLLIRGGNDYAVPYADVITDMELESKRFTIVDESVPFYQIALHGLKNYTGSAINLAADYERNILKIAETGSGLYFSFMDTFGGDLQNTNYTRYFASDVSRWSDKALELYNKFNSTLSHTYSQYIVGHGKLADQVYYTKYEDGTMVVVNYGTNEYSYEERSVAAGDFIVMKAGE